MPTIAFSCILVCLVAGIELHVKKKEEEHVCNNTCVALGEGGREPRIFTNQIIDSNATNSLRPRLQGPPGRPPRRQLRSRSSKSSMAAVLHALPQVRTWQPGHPTHYHRPPLLWGSATRPRAARHLRPPLRTASSHPPPPSACSPRPSQKDPPGLPRCRSQ